MEHNISWSPLTLISKSNFYRQCPAFVMCFALEHFLCLTLPLIHIGCTHEIHFALADKGSHTTLILLIPLQQFSNFVNSMTSIPSIKGWRFTSKNPSGSSGSGSYCFKYWIIVSWSCDLNARSPKMVDLSRWKKNHMTVIIPCVKYCCARLISKFYPYRLCRS